MFSVHKRNYHTFVVAGINIRILILETTISWLIRFLLYVMILFTDVDSCDISSPNLFMVASTVTFPFRSTFASNPINNMKCNYLFITFYL